MSDAETAVQNLLTELGDAWQRGDGEAWSRCFWDDSDYVAFDGTWLRGRAENTRLHAQLFRTLLRGTRLESHVAHVRFLHDDVALVTSQGAVLWPWQRHASKRALSRQTTVLARREGVWKIAAFQNTRVRPVPPMPEGSLIYRLFRAFVRIRMALASLTS